MPINVAHNIDPGLLGAVALLTGQGRNQQALAAQAADEAFRQAQLAEQSRRANAQLDLAQQELAQQGQQFGARLQSADRQANLDRQAQLYSNNQRYNFGAFQTLADNATQRGMLNDRLGAGLLQQQLAGQQDRASAADRFGQQLYLSQLKERYAQRAGEEERILAALPKMDPWEQQDLIGKFNERWQGLGLPGFQEIQPEMAGTNSLEEDPPAFAAQMNEVLTQNGFTASAYVNPKDGSVTTLFRPDQDPVYLQKELAAKVEIERMKQEFKAQQQQQQQQLRQQQLEQEFSTKQTQADVDLQYKAALDRLGPAPKRSEFQVEVPVPGSLTGATTKKIDEEAYAAAHADWERRHMEITQARLNRYQQIGGQPQGQSPDQPVQVRTPEEAMALPSGTKFITPDGEVRVRQ